MIIYFYKIDNGKLIRGSGTKIPNGMTEYIKGSAPKEFLEIYNKEIEEKKALEEAKAFNSAIHNLLDAKAKEYRYDNMMSVRSYTGYQNAFQEEARKLAKWASDVWVVAGEIESDVVSGIREKPTVSELLEELPKYDG